MLTVAFALGATESLQETNTAVARIVPNTRRARFTREVLLMVGAIRMDFSAAAIPYRPNQANVRPRRAAVCRVHSVVRGCELPRHVSVTKCFEL
jgi:hypothetical protein